jgi:hypothetical protein
LRCSIFITTISYIICENKGRSPHSNRNTNLCNIIQALWLTMPFFNLCLTLTKISVVLLYMRLFRNNHFIIASKILLVLMVISGFWVTLSGLFMCIPVNAAWDSSITHKKCLPVGIIRCVNAAIHLGSYLVLLVMPMPLLVRLRFPLKEKVFVVLIFLVADSYVPLLLPTFLPSSDIVVINNTS